MGCVCSIMSGHERLAHTLMHHHMVIKAPNFFINVLLFALLSIIGNAQEPSANITQSESLDTVRIVRSFTQRLEQTIDLTPLIDEFFTRDFIPSYLKEIETNGLFIIVKPKVAQQVDCDELLRFYIASLNAGYLYSVNFHSKYPSALNKDFPDEVFFPIREHGNSQFDGSIPDNYDRFPGQILFKPFAADLAEKLVTI